MTSNAKQSGISLVELLVALTLFAVLMLSLSQMQLRSLVGSTDSTQRAHALHMAKGLIDRMYANNSEKAISAYIDNIESFSACTKKPATSCEPATGTADSTACTIDELAEADLWSVFCTEAQSEDGAGTYLLEPKASMQCSGSCSPGAPITLTISWTSRLNDNDARLRDSSISRDERTFIANRDFLSLEFIP